MHSRKVARTGPEVDAPVLPHMLRRRARQAPYNKVVYVEDLAELCCRVGRCELECAGLRIGTAIFLQQHGAHLQQHGAHLQQHAAHLQQHVAHLQQHAAHLQQHAADVEQHFSKEGQDAAHLQQHFRNLQQHSAHLHLDAGNLEQVTAHLELDFAPKAVPVGGNTERFVPWLSVFHSRRVSCRGPCGYASVPQGPETESAEG